MDNGANLDYYTEEQLHCFPAFIKAEACTQYLDLRPYEDKIKNGEYEPRKIEDGNEVPGVILVQRTNTNSNNPEILDYKAKSDFDALVSSNNKDAINYFTIDEKGNLIIAKWNHTVVTVNGTYPKNIDDSEKETAKDEYTITTEPIAYSEKIKQFIMPFDFLVQLLVITEEPDFCMELVDCILDSKIVINIQEEETFTESDETRKYTIYTKDEKRINYKVEEVGQNIDNENNHFLNYRKDNENKECTNYSDPPSQTTVKIHTEITSHSYGYGISEADTWMLHYKETYNKQDPSTTEPSVTTTKEQGKYKKTSEDTVIDNEKIENDKDVKKFINDEVSNYKAKTISPPPVNILSGKDDNGNYKQIQVIDGGNIESVEGWTNGALIRSNARGIYRETKDEKGKGTGEYNLPNSIIVKTSKVNETNTTKTIPSLEYTYKINSNKTGYQFLTNIDPKCIVDRLNIKNFERIDLDVNYTTSSTKYPADSNPTVESHFYATKSGKPGNGYGDKNKEYEKFLLAYDNSSGARNQINSIESWLFEMMEKRDETVELVDVIKYMLYMYDGRSRGITELDLDLYKPSSFTNVSSSNMSILKEYIRKWEHSTPPPTNADGTKYIIEDDGAGNPTVGYGIDIENNKYLFVKEGYPTTLGSEVDIDFVDAIEDEILENAVKEIKSRTSNLNLTDYQINALVSRSYNCGVNGAVSFLRGSPQLNFVNSYNKYWKDTDDKFEEKDNNANFSHSLYTQYMSEPVTSNGIYMYGLERRRKSEWTLFQTGYYDVLDKWHSSSSGILQVADQIHQQEITWLYYEDAGGGLFWNDIEKSLNNPNKVTCCATYVGCVLYKAGYFTESQMNSFNYNFCPTFYSYLESQGWSKINSYNDLEPGDIVFLNNCGHVQIYAGNDTWYNAGSTEAIQGLAPCNQGNYARNGFYAAFRPK